ncbi:chemotaxis protein CheX [Acetobacteraceae bacterium H6797]|nr:chemotaxis protein CheX [Acetobacteraceae bacterium H6797]
MELTEFERDALTELVNIGVSRAAANLRKMVNDQVILSVPSLEVVPQATAAAMIREREASELVAVRQDFTGAFAGRAMLIFPQSTSVHLLHAILGEALDGAEAEEMEREALAETGNIILNGCLATMANMLKGPLDMSLPSVVRGQGDELFTLGDSDAGPTPVLFLYINFSMRNSNIRGYIAMLMNLPSLAALKVLVNDFIQRVMEDDGQE